MVHQTKTASCFSHEMSNTVSPCLNTHVRNMAIFPTVTLVFFWILGNAYAQDFYVVAPSALRLNYDETVAIAIDGNRGGSAKVKIQDHPSKRDVTFEKNILIRPGKPELFKVYLNASQFSAEFLSNPQSEKMVSLSVHLQNVHKEILIPISNQAGYMFVQSAKPIYNPRERAVFRITPLTEDGVPSQQKFKFQIKNPQGVVVNEKFFNDRRKEANYFAEHYYQFPKYPTLGEWKAVVRYGQNLELNSSISFDLKEYVLPTFTVKIRKPPVILPTAETISIRVESQYVYGKPVNGVALLKVGVKKPGDDLVIYFYSDLPKEFKYGVYTVRIPTNTAKAHNKIGWFPNIEGSHLCVEATVVDDATGVPEVERDCSTPFSVSPYEISFKRCLTDFKPGLPSVFEADITFFNGTPAYRIPVTISAVADNGKQIIIKQNTANSSANGRVAFEIRPENHHKTITFTLQTNDPLYGRNQVKGTFIQNAYQSQNKAYVAISRMSPLRLEPGDIFGRDVHFNPTGLQNIYYVVVARGKILLMDKLLEGEYKIHRMQFRITYSMTPSFRVIVFAHYRNDLIADSLKIEVGKTCDPKSEVTITTKFDEAKPAGGGKIFLRGEKGTYFGLYAIDEAVYSLSEKDVLTKAKMFDKLESHDLGCGPGGGLNVHSVLGNAGITVGTNKFSPLQEQSCVALKRRKRLITRKIMFSYPGDYKKCCSRGLKRDKWKRSCEDMLKLIEDDLDAVAPNCSAVFYECCLEGEKHKIKDYVYDLGNAQNGEEGFLFIDRAEELRIEKDLTIRKNFREIWIEKIDVLNTEEYEMRVTLPHSITTWNLQAISVNPTHGVCIAEPKKIVTFKKIFLHVNIPYSIKLFEQIEVEATVFNYGDKTLKANVYMYGVDGICSGAESGEPSERKIVEIEKESATTVTFSIVPLKVQNFAVTFVALTSDMQDKVEKVLHVVPPGIMEEKTFQIKLDPSNRQGRLKQQVQTDFYSDTIYFAQNLQVIAFNFTLPNDTVPGTDVFSITASGEPIAAAVETTINNPDSLIKQPHGCGEQNLADLAPTVYTMRYLQATQQLTPERTSKGTEFIRKGYDNEMEFKKDDGSYSVWSYTPTSTWLTAFVVKVFCQAREFTPIDNKVISSGLAWLINNQQPDGSFIERHVIYHREMMGGVDGVVSMTAFGLIALSECEKNDQDINLILAKQKAIAYLEDQVLYLNKPLSTAVIAYALALSNSDSKHIANDKLLNMAKRDRGLNYLYWQTENTARDVETAGYGLLTQLIFNNVEQSNSIVNWLNTKQLGNGRFASTQDTVIALQALSEYAIKRNMPTLNLVSNITTSRNASFLKTLTFNNENALDVQEVIINVPDKSKIFINTNGDGMGSLSINLRYNLMKEVKDICKFNLTYNLEESVLVGEKFGEVDKKLMPRPERRKRETLNNVEMPMNKKINITHKRENEDNNKKDYVLKLEICVRYLEKGDAGMSIVDVGIFSGLEPVMSQLDELVKDRKHLIQQYQKWNKGIAFYLETVPSSEPYCFGFDMTRKYVVGNIQSSVIKVYDYYNPDAHCTKFYSPGKKSGLLSTICEFGVCQCAEGGCPPKDPFEKFKKMNMADRKEDIKTMLCDEYDFVWKGQLSSRMGNSEGRLNISFQVEEVIKAGSEKKENLEKKIRRIYAQSHCDTSYLYSGAMYLIVGKDPPPRRVNDTLYYQYFLNSKSIVYHLVLDENGENEEILLDLEYVLDELKTEGCLK